MTDTLTPLIEIALAGNWDMFGHAKDMRSWRMSSDNTTLYVYFPSPGPGSTKGPFIYSLEQIIFNIEWAKAVFGVERFCISCCQKAEPWPAALHGSGKYKCGCKELRSYKSPFLTVAFQYHMKQYAPMTPEGRDEYFRRWLDER